MHATPSLLHQGFWRRSLGELQRLTNIAFKLEAIKGPSGPWELHSFHNPEAIEDCKVMSDIDIGGQSTAHLDWVAPSEPTSSPSATHNPNGYARFHGVISTQLPKNRPDIKRTGYAGWRTKDRPGTIFGRSLWNIDAYSYLAMRVKSDGRSYFINVQTESLIPTDLHQHRLFTTKPGEWQTILIRWNDFVRTNHGYVVEPQTEILRQKVRSIGIGLTDRIPGPFEMCIERIWTTNDASEADSTPKEVPATATPDVGLGEGELKNKQGKKMKWGSQ
ncbi:putative complex I protein [Cercophora scortea]|uniref:Complex I protein n=1 Tax=Cercophora scortea TaxID=314031 RepID=A0AAE0MMS0_9PEZI|nr:putative complex I protein [Cercophora scortea]